MLCEFCNALSISALVDLAKVEFRGQNEFPRQAYYSHQPSYAELVRFSENECSLCRLILSGCRRIIGPSAYSIYEGMTRDEVALQIEAEGEPSDIRICINADSLYLSEDLAKVELFDVLVVQIGDPEQLPLSELSISEDKAIPPFRLALSVPRVAPANFGRYFIGRSQIDADTGSQSNYHIAKDWIQNCSANHKSCPGSQPVSLPTRVIDVGDSNDAPVLRIVNSGGSKATYAALSHCWGGDVSSKLKCGDPASFYKGIVLEELPANFRDAVTITRELEIRYLWIDNLCIIQDSAEDWEKESKNMGSIYRNALVTISAAMSSRSTDGIFRNGTASTESKQSVLLSLDRTPGIEVTVTLKDDGEESLTNMLSKSPLAKRAWTLQEGILSPRVLFYGERQIYWKCTHGFQSADGISSGTLVPEDDSFSAISRLLHSTSSAQPDSLEPPAAHLILDEYYRLVSEYSKRSLTYESDKLPAFSGLAAAIQPALGCKYLAGIWSSDLRQGLVWYRDIGTCRHKLFDQAPSWSWAVTSDPVLFDQIPRKDIAKPHDAQLLRCHIEPKSQNKYGQVVLGGHLVIDGLTRKLLRSTQVVAFWDEGIAMIYYDEPEGDDHSNSVVEIENDTGTSFLSICDSPTKNEIPHEARRGLELDDIDLGLISGREYLILLIQSYVRILDGVAFHYAACLILLKTDEEDAYIRVGVLVSDIRNVDESYTWTESWERRRLKIF